MQYITMPNACYLACTSKNPIKRAINLGEVYADKDNLGRWRIDEISFGTWLRLRRSERKCEINRGSQFKESYLRELPQGRCLYEDEMKEAIRSRLFQMARNENKAWEKASSIREDCRDLYLEHLKEVRHHKSFLENLLSAFPR